MSIRNSFENKTIIIRSRFRRSQNLIEFIEVRRPKKVRVLNLKSLLNSFSRNTYANNGLDFGILEIPAFRFFARCRLQATSFVQVVSLLAFVHIR